MRSLLTICIVLLTIPDLPAATLPAATLPAATQVKGTSQGAVGSEKSFVFEGTVQLPAEGLWEIRSLKNHDFVREIYLLPSGSWQARQLGKRMYAALEADAISKGQWSTRAVYSACREFAFEGNRVGPSSLEELGKQPEWADIAKPWTSADSWNDELLRMMGKTIKGPFIYLIPNVKFDFVNEPYEHSRGNGFTPPDRWIIPHKTRRILAFELQPFVNDGQHWVLYTDGACVRVEIDRDLIQKTGQKIHPIVSDNERRNANERKKIVYRVIALTNGQDDQAISFEARNHVIGETRQLQWKLSSARKTLDHPRQALMQARAGIWNPYLIAGNGGVLQTWAGAESGRPQRRNRGRRTSVFSVLGGRAAVEETLQMQTLAVSDAEAAQVIDIDSMQGVSVKSHPFKDMLAGNPGGQLELARYAPQDHFFLYLGKPSAVATMLDSGAPFMAAVGSALTGNALNYGLEKRYLNRLGINRDQLNAILKSGLVREMALFCPDLFFIDGTELTVIARVEKPELLQRLVRLLNPAGRTSDSIIELPGAGKPAYLAMREELLFLGTNQGELKKALALHASGGKGSLGDSDEFRYMLTQLGISNKTRGYAYFSDPFVRRLVGPRVKIAQLRRMLAKGQMEALTAQAMLARLDDPEAKRDLKQLVASGYVPESMTGQGYSLDASGLVHSEVYGTLTNMRSLSEVPVQDITDGEAKAYREYMQNYSNYWRRFFDPIAIRLDEATPDQLELSTFILPLVDNSIYNGLRAALESSAAGRTLSIPVIEPTPVVKFSVNLSDQAWQSFTRSFAEMFTRYSGTSSSVLDDLGPSMHLAIFDSDPVIALGSGDVFGSFGSSVLGGNADSMLMIPIGLSMLTRPCSILVETQNPERTAQLMRQAAATNRTDDSWLDDFQVQIFQVGERDEWVWMMDVMGVVKLRYGIEIIDRYIVIRNIPWSSDERIIDVSPAELNAAALQVNPAACIEQLPGLFAAASDANSRVAMSGLGRLLPFMMGKEKTTAEATAEHERLFGFYPKRVAGDQLIWEDYHLRSQDYGEPVRQRQPVFDPEKPFGLMNQIDFLRLEMQFEDDGLRSSIRWRTRRAP